MEKLNITTICNTAAGRKPERHDWGFSFTTDTELDALRIAYAYRNSLNGVKAEHCPNIGKFIVTVWNDAAKASGMDV